MGREGDWRMRTQSTTLNVSSIFFSLQERDIFDSKKKIKVATAEGTEKKLNDHQRQCIAYNKCLVLMYSNQVNILSQEGQRGLQLSVGEPKFPCRGKINNSLGNFHR